MMKEEYGELELDDYSVESQNPNPKGQSNKDLIGKGVKSVMEDKVVAKEVPETKTVYLE